MIALLRSGIHEEPLLSLVILCDQFERGDGGDDRVEYLRHDAGLEATLIIG